MANESIMFRLQAFSLLIFWNKESINFLQFYFNQLELTFSANNFRQLFSESAASAKFVILSCSLALMSNRLEVLRSASSSFCYKKNKIQIKTLSIFNFSAFLTVWLVLFKTSGVFGGSIAVDALSIDLRRSGESATAMFP